MQRLPNDLVGHMRPIKVAGVDVIDAARDRFAQHRDRGSAVLGRPEPARSGELHGAVAKPVHHPVADRKRFRGSDVVHKLISSWTGSEYRPLGGGGHNRGQSSVERRTTTADRLT